MSYRPAKVLLVLGASAFAGVMLLRCVGPGKNGPAELSAHKQWKRPKSFGRAAPDGADLDLWGAPVKAYFLGTCDALFDAKAECRTQSPLAVAHGQ